jgi:hypothetical protein
VSSPLLNFDQKFADEDFDGVGHSFLDAIDQEQGNTIVNSQRPLSFEALSPLGYNDLQTKVMKDIPSSF